MIKQIRDVLRKEELVKDYDVSIDNPQFIGDNLFDPKGSFSHQEENRTYNLEDIGYNGWSASDLGKGFFKVWTNERVLTLNNEGEITEEELPPFYMHNKIYA